MSTTAQLLHATQDALNHAVWEDARAVRGYGRAEGFTDRGEEALYQHVRARVQDDDILDIGVGGGRTVPLLLPLARRYIALDYTQAMVETCHRRFPEVDVRHGDARDLSNFADESFGLVTFSFNGIDAVDHAGRAAVLHEVHRVLRPGGLFWFSTLNLHGMGLKLRPWKLEWPQADGNGRVRFAFKVARYLLQMPKRLWRYARLRPRFEHGAGWSIDTLSAHDFGLLVHYTSLEREKDELTTAGFELEQALDSSFGEPAAERAESLSTFWFQLLARKCA